MGSPNGALALAATRIVKTASRLQMMRVVTEHGKMLGHVVDLRSDIAPQSRAHAFCVIDKVVYGRYGLLERLGLREPTEYVVEWTQVIDVRSDAIVVRAQRSGVR